MKEGTIIFYGNYYLGEVYDINVIQNLPVCKIIIWNRFQTNQTENHRGFWRKSDRKV